MTQDVNATVLYGTERHKRFSHQWQRGETILWLP